MTLLGRRIHILAGPNGAGKTAIPEDVIRRRFAAGRANFDGLYKPIVERWTLYDSAGDQPVVLDHGYNP